MDLGKISAGRNVPDEINVVIEIPSGSAIKYEVDKDSGALMVDRFLSTAMFYPSNYGFVPQSLSDDGDPCDVLVLSQLPVAPGSVIRARPIGALLMEDESGQDEKILAVPVDKLDAFYSAIQSYTDIPQIFLDQVVHFFQHYKDLEKNKWVKVLNWVDADEAKKLITTAIAKASKG
jgi:inorganic pyrophosphatase